MATVLPTAAGRGAAILHVDVDAFFAAVEERDRPSLRGLPIVVGGLGPRGVVATCNYPARALGIGSAMPMWQARARATGRTAFLAPRFAAYSQSSEVVMAVLREQAAGRVEQVSIDEAFADLSGVLDDPFDADQVRQVAERIRARVRELTGLTVSVGAGGNKTVAKVASGLCKPDGLLVVPAGQEASFLAPLPVPVLSGVGPATQLALARHRITTVGQLAALDLATVVDIVGDAHGRSLWSMANGVDRRELVLERVVKSVSNEVTFATDQVARTALHGQLDALATRVAARLASVGVAGRTVTVKVRLSDLRTLTRSETLRDAVGTSAAIASAARRLLAEVDVAQGVRLLGVGVSGLGTAVQEVLFDPDDEAVSEAAVDTQGASPAGSPNGTGDAGARWRSGMDVVHAERGRGWVQGSGAGVVTVRFEMRADQVPGPVVTMPVDDPMLAPCDPEPLGDQAHSLLEAIIDGLPVVP